MMLFKKRTPTDEQKRGFGRMVREGRKRLGFTQEELAELLGCSDHWINKIECGRSNPTWTDAFLLAGLFEMPLSKILEEAEIHVPVLASGKRS